MVFNVTPIFIFLWSIHLCAVPLYQEPWGKDSELRNRPLEQIKKERNIAVRVADAVIDFHQQVISPVDGPRSHFRPSSSQYMRQAIYNYGFIKGFIMGCDRLLRENGDDWIYRKVEENGEVYKLDPAVIDKS
jgi:putative component of membrane protein insertase Oxa1/YidC/SpoIIIJ protein YidD